MGPLGVTLSRRARPSTGRSVSPVAASVTAATSRLHPQQPYRRPRVPGHCIRQPGVPHLGRHHHRPTFPRLGRPSDHGLGPGGLLVCGIARTVARAPWWRSSGLRPGARAADASGAGPDGPIPVRHHPIRVHLRATIACWVNQVASRQSCAGSRSRAAETALPIARRMVFLERSPAAMRCASHLSEGVVIQRGRTWPIYL